jgi:hypothetical protein
MVSRRHHGASARLLDRGADGFRIGRHHDVADPGGIGLPAMSASGLPGSRLDASRAGIRTMTSLAIAENARFYAASARN